MALGFGKKKAEPAAEAAAAPQNAAPAGETADFDADTFALDQFASDLEAAGSSTDFASSFGQDVPPPAPLAGASDDSIAWDDTALLNFDDPSNLDSPSGDGHARAGARSGEVTPFDDLARELEGIPSMAADFGPADDAFAIGGAAAAAVPENPEAPERRTRRKAVSADLKEALAAEAPEKGAKKPKKEKPLKLAPAEGKKKPPLVAIIGVVAVLLLGGGAAMFFKGGSSSEEVTEPPTELPVAGAPENGAPAPAPETPEAGAPKPAAGAKPETGAPAAPGGKKPVDEAKLKSLWEKGKAAKHDKKFDEARKAWTEILKLDPGHAGIQDAIDKLPKKAP